MPGETMVCPICGGTRVRERAKLLYGIPVCNRCYYNFANRRQLAFVLDSLIWTLSVRCVRRLVLAVLLTAWGASETALETAGYVFEWITYPFFLLKDGFGGYSPGKALMGVQVVTATSQAPISFWASFKRNIPLAIPFLPLVVAFQLKQGRRFGDGWAHTRVIWTRYKDKLPFATSVSSPVRA